MQTYYCSKCEGANDALTEVSPDYALCVYCLSDWEFIQERGQLFQLGYGTPGHVPE